MNTVYKKFCKGEEILVGIVFLSIVILIFIAAIFRTFDVPIVWADDIAKFLFSWAAFLGADVAMRHSRLVGVDLLVNKLPRKAAKAIQLIVFGLIVALLVSFVFYGLKLSISSFDRHFQSLKGFSYSYVTLSLPVSSALMIITAFTKIGKIIKHFKEDDYEVLRDQNV